MVPFDFVDCLGFGKLAMIEAAAAFGAGNYLGTSFLP